jgi:hypothetical protein
MRSSLCRRCTRPATSAALPLLAQARTILRLGGQLLYCDHYFEDGKKAGLLLDRAEQPEVLLAAGYSHVELLRDEGGMALYTAR